MGDRGAGFWFLQVSGWALLCYLFYAQAISAFSYDLGVQMGTQESADQITEVGAAFWYGLAFGDLLVYMPLLAVGLIGLWLESSWARVILGSALGITVYWPVVSLATVVAARDADGWSLPNETDYWIVLPVIVLWALWGLRWVASTARRGS